jgi:DNA recombination protein RmuC
MSRQLLPTVPKIDLRSHPVPLFMPDFLLPLLALGVALCLLLQLFTLLRKPKVELPEEWLMRLVAIEQSARSMLQSAAKNEGALEGVAQQMRSLSQTSAHSLESVRHAVDDKLIQINLESRTGRKELSDTLTGFRTELTAAVSALAAETVKSREAMVENALLFETRIQERFEALTAATRQTLDSLKADIHTQLGVMSSALKDQLEGNSYQIKNQFSSLQEAVSQQLTGLVQGSQQNAEQLRVALNERLAAIQHDNTTKLEEMRRTVDEKLHATLEQRLGESFKLVSERLEQVQAGLGEMKTLASSVGDLKRVMTNVKSRGTWGEMQLGAIIENVLTIDQYAKNVKTVPNSNDLVEFAIRLPGKHEEHPVWLPIDSKYPVEHYQRLMDAQDAMDKVAILQAGNAFESSMKLEAKKIVGKYISPPHTTDFAILYLPTEGLFAEVIRRPGLVEAIQNDCRVMITGPANLAAMLNSLQMGFKTLAIEKRSSEVWSLLGIVKTEFSKFGEIVEATKKSIDVAASKFNDIGVRTRAIQRRLREVEELPVQATPPLTETVVAVLEDE